ncbi:tetratricopeptide repeat protein [Verrucomicrobiota bacterium]
MRIRILILIIVLSGLCSVYSASPNNEADAILSKGKAAMEDGLYDLAEKQINLYLGKAGSSLSEERAEEVIILLARSLYEQRKYEKIFDVLNLKGTLVKDMRDKGAVYYWRGMAGYELGNYDEALKELSNVGSKSKKEHIMQAERLRAWCYLEKGEIDKALEIFERFDKVYGDSEDGSTNLLEWGRTLVKVDRQKPAQEVLSRLVKLPGELPEVQEGHYWLGQVFIRQKHWKDAVNVLTSLVISKDISDDFKAKTWLSIGVAQSALGNSNEVVSALQKGIELARDPDLKIRGGFELGWYFIDTERFEEGVPLLKKHISASPADPRAETAQLKLAGSLLDHEKNKEAINEFQYYLETFTNSTGQARAYSGKGWGFINIGRYAEAATAFSKAYNLHEDPSKKEECLFKMGDAHFANGQYKLAQETYRQLTSEFPASSVMPNVLYQLAESMNRAGQQKEAKLEFRNLIDKYANSPFSEEALLHIAEITREQGLLMEAIEGFNNVINTYSNGNHIAEAIHGRGMVLHGLYRFEEALEDFESVVRDYPADAVAEQAFFMRGMCHYGLWRDERALAICRDFIKRYQGSRWAPEVMFWIAKYEYNHGHYESAGKDFEVFAEKFQDNSLRDDALLWAGRAASKRKEYVHAIELFTKFIKEYPNPSSRKMAGVRFAQADAFCELGQYPEAILIFDEIINKYSESDLVADSINQKGYCQFMLGNEDTKRYEESIESYRIVANDSNVRLDLVLQAECMIGRCYEKLDKMDEALEQYYLKVIIRYFEELEKKAKLNEACKRWFTRAAFYAVGILEKRKEWRKAVSILKRVEKAGVPGADEALESIKRIRSEHWWLF